MSRMLQVAIRRPAQACFDRFCEVERLPEWVPEVIDAQTLNRDEGGRPAEVRFRILLDDEEQEYTVLYAYDLARRRVTWYPGTDSGHEVRGFASFDRAGQSGCRMIYSLNMGPEREDFDDEETDQASEAIEAFRKWMESTS